MRGGERRGEDAPLIVIQEEPVEEREEIKSIITPKPDQGQKMEETANMETKANPDAGEEPCSPANPGAASTTAMARVRRFLNGVNAFLGRLRPTMTPQRRQNTGANKMDDAEAANNNQNAEPEKAGKYRTTHQ